MTAAVRAFVRQRAGNRCEYCRLHQHDSILAALHIEHVRPRKHGGTDDETNLAMACIDCNLSKGSNLTGIDPVTEEIASLYHPRRQLWEDHFAFDGTYIVGLTSTGRTTVEVLRMNSDEQLSLRDS